MSELPKMYHSSINKDIKNNKSIYISYNKHDINIVDNTNIRDKINSILMSNNFIYSKWVNINVNGKIIRKKIIGIYNNNLITIDNEQISIDNIRDIYY